MDSLLSMIRKNEERRFLFIIYQRSYLPHIYHKLSFIISFGAYLKSIPDR